MKVKCEKCGSILDYDDLIGVRYDPGSPQADSYMCPNCGAVDEWIKLEHQEEN